jgi:hypothetical protein
MTDLNGDPPASAPPEWNADPDPLPLEEQLEERPLHPAVRAALLELEALTDEQLQAMATKQLNEQMGRTPSSEPEPVRPLITFRVEDCNTGGWQHSIVTMTAPSHTGLIRRAILWEPGVKRRRAFELLKTLHSRRLLPPCALIIDALPDGAFCINVDASEDWAAEYAVKVAAIRWATGPVYARALNDTTGEIAGLLHLGVVEGKP